jgi:hypothetical protein
MVCIKEEMDARKLLRVDSRFRVIALGLPIPPFVVLLCFN